MRTYRGRSSSFCCCCTTRTWAVAYQSSRYGRPNYRPCFGPAALGRWHHCSSPPGRIRCALLSVGCSVLSTVCAGWIPDSSCAEGRSTRLGSSSTVAAGVRSFELRNSNIVHSLTRSRSNLTMSKRLKSRTRNAAACRACKSGRRWPQRLWPGNEMPPHRALGSALCLLVRWAKPLEVG